MCNVHGVQLYVHVCMREAKGMIFIGACVHTCTFRCLHSWRTLCVELETAMSTFLEWECVRC